MEYFEHEFNRFIESTKTLNRKIELDIAEGVKTNPLYIEMFSYILRHIFENVQNVRIWCRL